MTAASLSPFETDRLMTRLIRETLGRAAVIGVYASPIFNVIGLIDRARNALDSGALDAPGPTPTFTAEAGNGNSVITQNAAPRWGHLKSTTRIQFDQLNRTAKLDTNTYDGYCNAGEG